MESSLNTTGLDYVMLAKPLSATPQSSIKDLTFYYCPWSSASLVWNFYFDTHIS